MVLTHPHKAGKICYMEGHAAGRKGTDGEGRQVTNQYSGGTKTQSIPTADAERMTERGVNMRFWAAGGRWRRRKSRSIQACKDAKTSTRACVERSCITYTLTVDDFP